MILPLSHRTMAVLLVLLLTLLALLALLGIGVLGAVAHPALLHLASNPAPYTLGTHP